MLFLLSPAKTFSETVPKLVLKNATAPRAAADVAELLPALKALSAVEIKSLMSVSDDLARRAPGRMESVPHIRQRRAPQRRGRAQTQSAALSQAQQGAL